MQGRRQHAVAHSLEHFDDAGHTDAAWVCPMFDFTDPNRNGRSAGRP